MRRLPTYVEADAGMATDGATAAWTFDVDLWGRCGQGMDEPTALAALVAEVGADVRPIVVVVTSCSPEVLDYDDAARVLPSWARWRTLRQMAWHLADTESRYYLPCLGLPYREPEPDLLAELAASAEHVRAWVRRMDADLVCRHRHETWTTAKVLRRLAWHERSELVTMHRLAARAAAAVRTRGA